MNPVLIDGDNFARRNIMASALDDLKANGTFTGGVFASLWSLHNILSRSDFTPCGVWAFFDCGSPPRRLKLIPGYKSKRKEDRKLLSEEDHERAMSQMAIIREVFDYLGVSCISYKEREADDCVPAAVRSFTATDVNPVVVSSDKDLLQTIGMGATVWHPGEKRWVNEDLMTARYATPEHFLLFRTLVGDTSDSIKGCRGCADKTAKRYIAENMESLQGLSPYAQLGVVAAGGKLEDAPAWQKNANKDYDRLNREMQGIDLSNSFGDDRVMAKRLKHAVPVQPRAFTTLCCRYSFQSVLNDPGFLLPFKAAARRRDEADLSVTAA